MKQVNFTPSHQTCDFKIIVHCTNIFKQHLFDMICPKCKQQSHPNIKGQLIRISVNRHKGKIQIIRKEIVYLYLHLCLHLYSTYFSLFRFRSLVCESVKERLGMLNATAWKVKFYNEV